jgi:PadR family transcriptional regulator PadR
MDELFRDMYVAFIRVHLLFHAVESPFYGLEMLEELARHGYKLSPGTLYPVLHGLESRGLLTCEKRLVNGRIRKYYRATEKGREALERVRPQIRELVREVLAGELAQPATKETGIDAT